MKKCLKIRLGASFSSSVIGEIQKKGSKLAIEGTIENIAQDDEMNLIVCGNKEEVDEFVDFLHKVAAKEKLSTIEIEPFIKTKDYRGAFRVIHE